MSRVALLVTAVALATGAAHADDSQPPDVIGEVARLMEDGKFVEARELLLQTYELAPSPAYLFALGQIEFNLDNFDAAISYYQKFLDSNPPPQEAALAQQAIGAARARIVAPEKIVIAPPPPPPRYERDWDLWSTSLVSFGGAAIVGGAIVLVHGYRMGEQRSADTMALYRDRLARSRRWQWTGAGVAAAGAVIIGAALVRFAVHRVEVISPGPSPDAIGLAVGRSW